MDSPEAEEEAEVSVVGKSQLGDFQSQWQSVSYSYINLNLMKLGAFSVSLTVKDISASKEFYENLGFIVFAGDIEKNYLIMKNDHILIGLFQGMFEKNILTFNPGWSQEATPLESYDDVRDIQKMVKAAGINLETDAIESTSGPASFVIVDPDGNPILVDQHI